MEALSTELEAVEGLSTEVVEVAARCTQEAVAGRCTQEAVAGRCTEVLEVVGGLGDLSLCLRRRL